MAFGRGITIGIVVEEVPVIEGALDAIRSGAIPAGLLANRSLAECISGDEPCSQISDDLRTLPYDPQTAGGLLVSVSADETDALLGSLRSAGLNAARIGSVVGPYVPGQGEPAIMLG